MKSFFLLLFLFGCGQGQLKNEVEKEVAGIENSDFVPVKEIPYKEGQDYFSNKIKEDDSLTRESIARLSPSKLEVVSSDIDPITKGISLCYQNKFAEGLAVFDGAYAQYKRHPSYWNQLGTCYFLHKELRLASLYYLKALDLNAKYTPALNNLGVIYQREGKDQKAILAFEKARETNSFSLTPVFNLAQMYAQYGFVDKALELFLVLERYKQNDVDVATGIANCYLLRGEIDRALAYFRRMAAGFLSRPYVGINYALALKLKGDNKGAKKILAKVEDDNLGEFDYYLQRVTDFVEK